VRGDFIVYTQQNDYPAVKGMEKIYAEPDISILIAKYKTPLYNLCFKLTLNRSEADDLFQETWINASRSLTNVEAGYFKQWLFRVCINKYRDIYRKESKRKEVFYDLYESSEHKDYVLENTNRKIIK